MTTSGEASIVGAAVTRAISVWGLLRPADRPDRRLLAAEARHLPHLLQYPLDPQQQIGAGAGRAGGVHSDGRQPFRSLGRLQCSASRRCWRSGCRARAAVVGGGAARCSLMGAAVGLVNGILVTRVKIDSFIATLGTGTVLYGLNAWYTGGQQVLAVPAAAVPRHISGSRLDHSAPAIYALIVSLALWVVFEYLPARPLSLCPRRQPARRGVERHFGQAIRHPRLRRRRNARLVRRHRPAIAAPGRPELCRAGISAAGLHRRAARRDLGPPGPGQRLGNGPRRRRARGDGRRPQSARRAVLRRAAVQRLDADSRGRPRGAGGAAPTTARRPRPTKRRRPHAKSPIPE